MKQITDDGVREQGGHTIRLDFRIVAALHTGLSTRPVWEIAGAHIFLRGQHATSGEVRAVTERPNEPWDFFLRPLDGLHPAVGQEQQQACYAPTGRCQRRLTPATEGGGAGSGCEAANETHTRHRLQPLARRLKLLDVTVEQSGRHPCHNDPGWMVNVCSGWLSKGGRQ